MGTLNRINVPPFSLLSSGVVNMEIEHGILQWELPSGLSEQVSAYHLLVYREGHQMESPPMWVTRRVYNLSNLHLAAGTYYIEVSVIIGSLHWRVYILHCMRQYERYYRENQKAGTHWRLNACSI